MKFIYKSIFTIAFVLLSPKFFSQSVTPAATTGAAAVIKYEGAIPYTYTISGLSTSADADSLETIFKDRPGIAEVLFDIPAHKITVYAPEIMPEADLWEVLRYAGKKILVNPKELTKYYPN